MHCAVRVQRSGVLVASRVRVARNPWERTVGFIGKSVIDPDEGIWFDRCNAIHMFGMRVALDVLFLDDHLRIVHIEPDLAPWRVARFADADSVLELRAGRARTCELQHGDRLIFE